MNANTIVTVVMVTLFMSIINFQAKSQAKENYDSDSTSLVTASSVVEDSQKVILDSLFSLGISRDSILIINQKLTPPLDTIDINLFFEKMDTLVIDTIPPPVGDIKTTVVYKSKDSITINMITRNVKIYGEANIDYNPISLEANEITVNWDKNLMEAVGQVDTTGAKIGTPIFSNGDEVYETNEIKYNFKTEKASISGLVTQQGQGYIHADKVFKNAKGELFNQETLYTTCNLADPHFSIKARKVKVIPGKEMISGPFNIIIHNVPLPIGFAFGIFPEQQTRTSGIIFPTFGEETRRGFYLREGGYYFALSDYFNLALTGDIYTRGGWGMRATSSYFKRYKSNGNFNFNYTKLQSKSETDTEGTESNDFRLSWSHSPESKGTGRFSASVNIATSSYNQNNYLDNIQDQVRSTLSSSVSYSKSFTGTPISMGLSGRFNQNVKTKQADLLLPQFSLNVQNLYPFRGKSGSSKSWYQKIAIRYSVNGTNKITNHFRLAERDTTVELKPENFGYLMQNGSSGFRHSIPLSTSFRVLKHFTVSPSLSYNELWYFKKLDYSYEKIGEEPGELVIDTLQGFNAVRTYGGSISANTRLYGTLQFKRKTGVQAIRHMMTPSLSFSYRPNFGDEEFDYYQDVQVNDEGRKELKSRYQGFVYGAPSLGESGSIGLSITNTLEMKYKNKKDTTNKVDKIPLLRNFGMNGSYNVVADSFKLSNNINVRATTTLLSNKTLGNSGLSINSININFSGALDPYIYLLDSTTYNRTGEPVIHQRKIDAYAWNNGKGLGQLSKTTVSLSTGFKSSTKKGADNSSRDNRRSNTVDNGYSENDLNNIQTNNVKEEMELQQILDNPDLYVDFTVPWSVRLSYNVNFTRVGFAEGKVTQSLRFNGDLSLSDNWKVTFNSGYDFRKKDFTQTRFNIVRDLHCWDMVLSWTPFGRFQSYNFTIKAKAALLQDLKISKKRNFTDSFGF